MTLLDPYEDTSPVLTVPVEEPEEGWGVDPDEPVAVRGMEITSVGELRRRPDFKIPWVTENILVVGAVTMLAGAEGEGKSLLALELASSVASGQKFAGATIHKQGGSLYVDAENGIEEMGRRCNLLRVTQSVSIAEADGIDLGDPGRWHEFSQLVRQTKPAFVVLDSLASLWPGVEENDKKSMQQALSPLRSLALQAGTSFMLLHHVSRGSGRYRGSTAIGAAVQIVIEMQQPDGDESIRKLRWRKNRYGRKGTAWTLKITERGDFLTIQRFG